MKKVLFAATVLLLMVGFIGGALYHNARQAERAGEVAMANAAALVREHARVLGPAHARVQIVEFLDPACGTCRRFYPLVKDILAAHPERIRLVLRYAPFHDGADYAVAVLEAAGRQGKYWETLEALLEAQDEWVVNHRVQPEQVWRQAERLGLDMDRLAQDMKAPEIARLIAQDLEDARTLQVSKTPEFFVNGRPLPSFGLEPLRRLVDEALAREYR